MAGNEAIIDKVRKLLNMTEDKGCSVAEAASAAALAQKLLSEHRLSVADLGEAPGMEEKIHNDSFLYEGERIVHWKSDLASTICNVNGCKMYYSNRYGTRASGRYGNLLRYQIIGRDSDIAVVTYFFNYLTAEIDRLANQAQRNGQGRGKTWSNSFKHGASLEVCQRLHLSNKEVRVAASNSTALVKLDNKDEEVSNWAEKNLELKKTPRKDSNLDYGAYRQGREAGAGIALNKGLGGEGIKELS